MKKFFQVLGIVALLLVGLYYIEECSGKKDQSEAVEDVQDDLEMEKSVHLKFKGVPIDGTLKEFLEWSVKGLNIVRRMIQRNGWWVTLQELNSVRFMWKHLIIAIWYLVLLSSFPSRNDGRNCLTIIKT